MNRVKFKRSALTAAASLIIVSGCASVPIDRGAQEQSQLYADFVRGRYASLRADSTASAQFYQDALKRAPKDQEILERAITRTLIAGDVRAAAKLERVAEENGAATSLGQLAVAADDLARGDYRPRKEPAAASDTAGPFNQVIATSLKAWAKAGAGDIDGAVAFLRGAASGSTLDRLNDYQVALIYDYAGRPKEALENYERAWKSGLRLAVDVDAYGKLLERQGDYDQAIAVYEEFISNVGANPTIQASLSRAKARTPAAPKISSPAQGAAISIFGPAAALTAQSGGEQAASYLQLTLHLDPRLDAARTLLAAGKAEAGRTEDSIMALREVSPESPYFTTARIEMMWALARLERNAEAVSAAEETALLAPSQQTRLALADLHRSLEHWAEAEKIYDAEISANPPKDDPETARIYFSRGAVRERLNRWPDAEADLLKALEMAPNDADVLNYLGYSWVDRGENIEKAMDLIERAVALQPESGFIVDSLGWAQFKLGRYEEATATLENAVELAPGEATINDHLGDAYWQVGRKIEARFQWTRTLSLKPSDTERTTAEEKLKNGLPPVAPKTVATEAAKNGSKR